MIIRLYQLAAVLSLLAAAGTLMAQPSGQAWLKTKVDPGRAGIFVDGKYVGPARNFGVARKYSIAPGEHKIKIVEPRYEDLETTVTATAGKTTVLSQSMKALPAPQGPFGLIRTEYPSDNFAAVYVNDHYMGHVDEFDNFAQRLKLPVGEYDVRIEGTKGSPVTQHVKVEADKTVIVK